MSKDLDWVDYFDRAYHNAVIYGTGFIKVSVNGPEGLSLSVVEPKDYRYLMDEPPHRIWEGLTEDEANELWQSTDSDWELMKRVEAKLKERNS